MLDLQKIHSDEVSGVGKSTVCWNYGTVEVHPYVAAKLPGFETHTLFCSMLHSISSPRRVHHFVLRPV